MWWWLVGAAVAKSWCANPLAVHEWGVDVLRIDGAAPVGKPLPSWFHTTGTGTPLAATAVRTLPKDTGERTLPVVQLFGVGDRVPFALEVGFAKGKAKAWFPEVDARRPAGPQLTWEALELRPQGEASAKAEVGWVSALRRVPGALWVGRGAESDRFLFYEATTTESPAVTFTRTDGAWILHNGSKHTVHDVVVFDGEKVAMIPAIPPGSSATATPASGDARSWLRARWVDPSALPTGVMDWNNCVMMRDPAVPVTASVDHHLYGPEIDVLLDTWADRLFQGGAHLIYREDVAAVDEAMPIAAYTDMHHWVDLRRLSVVLVEGL